MSSQTTLEENIVELHRYIDIDQTPQNSRPKIQRVPQYLRNRTKFEEHYTPKLVSIGPIHHDNPKLKIGEKYKLMWAAKYIKNTGRIKKDLHKKIVDNIDELKEKAKLHEPGQMNIKVDKLVLVMMDVLLLENQLPYIIIRGTGGGETFKRLAIWLDSKGKEQHSTVLITNELETSSKKEKEMVSKGKGEGEHSVSIPLPSESQSETPTHLFDLQRKLILNPSNSKIREYEASKEKWSKSPNESISIMTYRSIQDLRKVGIRLKSSMTRSPRDLDFSEGWLIAKLTLPEIVVDDSSATTYLNLIAYEMCPDFKNNYRICSFAAFMDSLIDHPEVVKLLRSKEILLNSLGSDEEIADLFKIIGTDLIPNTETYFRVRAKIDYHYRNKCKTWIVLGYYTYFSIAAFIALALTFIQTVFAIHPASNNGC
ncbi:DUF247 domain protein [Medicago truncatula]|uniref:DUF247 domain protein n=1 Tax=Medicago truncatula TaxID=3880 RepID=A0A072U0D6_MEDTR|nr:DUF247 domain protein [Medicago truncatula]